MTILTYPHPALNKRCVAVAEVTPELVAVAKQMYKTMIDAHGVGLSANQVGLTIRLIVLENKGMLAMFNPIIQQLKTPKILNESCLSAPGEVIKVRRNTELAMKYRDINNKMQFIKLTGLLAQAVQHEVEHLNGEDFRKKEVKDENKDQTVP